jgi:hypothetical protein
MHFSIFLQKLLFLRYLSYSIAILMKVSKKRKLTEIIEIYFSTNILAKQAKLYFFH